MGGKTAIALGLVTGLVVGGLIVGGAIAFVPTVSPASPSATPAPAAPSAQPATGAPSASPIVPAPSGVPSATAAPVGPSAAPASGAPPAAASALPSEASQAEVFGIGEPAPPLVLPLAGGDSLDLAGYRGKPG